MPKRKSTRKVKSTEIQGPDSWVVINEVKYGYVMDLRKKIEDPEISAEESEKLNAELLATTVNSWNWVDDDDKPLPTPSENDEVINDLTAAEMAFLQRAISGNEERKK